MKEKIEKIFGTINLYQLAGIVKIEGEEIIIDAFSKKIVLEKNNMEIVIAFTKNKFSFIEITDKNNGKKYFRSIYGTVHYKIKEKEYIICNLDNKKYFYIEKNGKKVELKKFFKVILRESLLRKEYQLDFEFIFSIIECKNIEKIFEKFEKLEFVLLGVGECNKNNKELCIKKLKELKYI